MWVLYLVCNITHGKQFAFCYLTRGWACTFLFSNNVPLRCEGNKGEVLCSVQVQWVSSSQSFLKLPSAHEHFFLNKKLLFSTGNTLVLES